MCLNSAEDIIRHRTQTATHTLGTADRGRSRTALHRDTALPCCSGGCPRATSPMNRAYLNPFIHSRPICQPPENVWGVTWNIQCETTTLFLATATKTSSKIGIKKSPGGSKFIINTQNKIYPSEVGNQGAWILSCYVTLCPGEGTSKKYGKKNTNKLKWTQNPWKSTEMKHKKCKLHKTLHELPQMNTFLQESNCKNLHLLLGRVLSCNYILMYFDGIFATKTCNLLTKKSTQIRIQKRWNYGKKFGLRENWAKCGISPNFAQRLKSKLPVWMKRVFSSQQFSVWYSDW